MFELRHTACIAEPEYGIPSDQASIPEIAFSTVRSWMEVATKYGA